MFVIENKIPEKYKDKTIYSFSRINSYANCPHSFYLAYILKKQGKDNIFSACGKVVHELLESLQFGKITNDEALATFRWKYIELTTILGYKFMTEKIEQNYIASIEHFIKNYKPVVCKNFLSEQYIITDFDNVSEKPFIPMQMYIDAIVFNEDGSVDVIDYKTSTEYSKEDLPKYGRQLVCYAMSIEKEFNIKVNKIAWNMLKYCRVNWQGATKEREGFYLRHELIKKLRNEIKKDLRALGHDEMSIELTINNAQDKNDFTLLPQEVQDKYKISDGIIEYPYNEETKADFINFIITNVNAIEDTPKAVPQLWYTKSITDRTSFFCGNLCGYNGYCDAFKQYMEHKTKKEEGESLFNVDNSNNMTIDLTTLFG